MDSDAEKANSVYRRLAAMQLEREDQVGAATTLTTLARRLPERRYAIEVWQSIAKILSGIQDLPEEHLAKVKKVVTNCYCTFLWQKCTTSLI